MKYYDKNGKICTAKDAIVSIDTKPLTERHYECSCCGNKFKIQSEKNSPILKKCTKTTCESDIKVTHTRTIEFTTYKVMSNGYELFDVLNIDTRYIKNNRWKLRVVSKDTYGLYLKFLTTGKKMYLTNAQRTI